MKKERKEKMKKKRQGIIQEFKKFISRGNVVDMATGVIVATAFTKIINALTNNIFMPIVNFLVYGSSNGKKGLLITILNNQPYYIDQIDKEGKVTQAINKACIYIDWGVFIEAIVNFLLISIIIFTIVKILNHIHNKLDLLKNKIMEDEILEQKRIEEEKAKQLAIEKAEQELIKAQADKEKAENSSTNALLVEIINLLNK